MIQLAYLLLPQADLEVASASLPTPPPPLMLTTLEEGTRITGVWPHRDLQAARRQLASYLAQLPGEQELRCLFTNRSQSVSAWRETFAQKPTLSTVFEARHAVLEQYFVARLFGCYQLGESDIVLISAPQTEPEDAYALLAGWANARLAASSEPEWDKPFPFGYQLCSLTEYDVADDEFWATLREALGTQHLRLAFDSRMETPAPYVLIEAADPSDINTDYLIGTERALGWRRIQRETHTRLLDGFDQAKTRLQVPNAAEIAGACDHLVNHSPRLGAPNFFAYREAPQADLDSGWRFGCLDPEHVHDQQSFRVVPLGQMARLWPGFIRYLGLPEGWTVSLDERRYWVTPPNQDIAYPDTEVEPGEQA